MNARIGILWIGLVVGCASAPETQPTARPGWATGLSEAPGELPAEALAAAPVPVVGARWGVTAGTPRDLTAPVAVGGSARPSRGGSASSSVAAAPVVDAPVRSSLERLYRGEFSQAPGRDLEQFGYTYFRQAAPRSESEVAPDDYRLGPGDELRVVVTGSFEEGHTLTVGSDGCVLLPGVGSVSLVGCVLEEARQVLEQAYGRNRRNFQVSALLERVRRVVVHVVGEVERPGPVELSARASVIEALAAAGGPRKGGSLRRVRLRRAGQESTLDLYGFLVEGATGQAERVRAGDVVVVPPIGATVAVAGYVRRPAIYELSDDALPLGEALELAGGLTGFSFTPRVQLERTVAGRGRALEDVTLDGAGRARPVRDGELLLVGAVEDGLQPIVRVSGEVVRPGHYQHQPGMRVSDLLALAEGPTVEAYLGQAFLSRQWAARTGEDGPPEGEAPSSGRQVVVIDLDAAVRGDPTHDLELHPLDVLSVRSRTQAGPAPRVQISGAVQRPGTFELTWGLRVSDLLALAGNALPEAHLEAAELVREVPAAGAALDVRRFRLDLRAALDGWADPLLQAGDQVIVRARRRAQVRARIEGEVPFPGEYVFPAGARITDLLAAAGGLTGDADLRASSFRRESVRELQAERFRHLIERTRRLHEQGLEEVANVGFANEALASRLSLQQTRSVLQRMERHEVTGRVVVPFVRDDFPGSTYDLTLESGDVLVVARRQETVSVVGHVFNPSTFVAEPGLTVEDVLSRAGGPLEDGDAEQLYVIRADGVVQSMASDVHALEEDSPLFPGDVVLVPRRVLERALSNEVAQGLALARQAAELAMIVAKIADPNSSVQLNSSQQQQTLPAHVSPQVDATEVLDGR